MDIYSFGTLKTESQTILFLEVYLHEKTHMFILVSGEMLQSDWMAAIPDQANSEQVPQSVSILNL